MDATERFYVTVEAGNAAEASRLAQALEKILLEDGPAADIERVRASAETLDGGTTLAIALASPVLLELARSLQVFLQRYKSSQITVSDARGTLIAKNVSAATAEELARKWAAPADGK
jgi:hypothetical protein